MIKVSIEMKFTTDVEMHNVRQAIEMGLQTIGALNAKGTLAKIAKVRITEERCLLDGEFDNNLGKIE